MSFNIGGNSSNSKNSFSGVDNTNSTTNFNQTSTPINPSWVDNTAQSINGGLTNLIGSNPSSYIAPVNGTLSTANNTAAGLSSMPWNYNAALGETGYVMGANAPQTQYVASQPMIQAFMNPFTNDVVNSSLAGFDNQAGQTKAQQALDLVKSGAFGGSGAAVDQALTNGQLALSRGQLESGLRSQGFNTALGAAQSEAARKQQANDLNAQLYGQQMDRALGGANQLGGLSSELNQNQIADVNAQTGIGSTVQAIQQQLAQSPLALQQYITSLFSNEPLQLFNGQTQVGTQHQVGTESQSGTSKGNTSGFGFGLTNSSGGGK